MGKSPLGSIVRVAFNLFGNGQLNLGDKIKVNLGTDFF